MDLSKAPQQQVTSDGQRIRKDLDLAPEIEACPSLIDSEGLEKQENIDAKKLLDYESKHKGVDIIAGKDKLHATEHDVENLDVKKVSKTMRRPSMFGMFGGEQPKKQQHQEKSV